jgi:hypothetical protein
MPICLKRPGASSAVFFDAAAPGFFTMQVRIRSGGPLRETAVP